jgi:hypothetical protein
LRRRTFTERERRAILKFFENKKRNAVINYVACELNASWQGLLADFKLLIKLRRLMDAGY